MSDLVITRDKTKDSNRLRDRLACSQDIGTFNAAAVAISKSPQFILCKHLFLKLKHGSYVLSEKGHLTGSWIAVVCS